jgi:hypothetical protein
MGHLWRIVNPVLSPPQVAFESGDEQAALREYAARAVSAHGHVLVKSEDNGTSWVGVEARAPAVGSVPIAAEVRASTPVTKVEPGEREREDFARLARDEPHFQDKSKPEGSKKTSK